MINIISTHPIRAYEGSAPVGEAGERGITAGRRVNVCKQWEIFIFMSYYIRC